MASDQDTTKLQTDAASDKEDVVANVRLKADDEKMIRRAAVELDTSRSEFMAEAAIARARLVLNLGAAQAKAS